MASFNSESPSSGRRTATSDEEVWYSTVSSAPPKRRAGRTKFRETRHPVYKGVRRRNADKWVCEVREPNKKSRIWLGTFPTAEMAARAHDVAAIALRGRGACLNFADSAWRLNVPNSTDSREIQRAAAEAAEAFRPQEGQQLVQEGAIGQGMGQVGEGSGSVQEDLFSMDDDEMHLGMQGYWDMAQGLLIDPPAPPPMNAEEDEESDGYLPLWSYSL